MLCARCVTVCCCIARPVHTRTWPVLLCQRLCPVTQGLVGPLHRACRAAPSVLSVWCCTTCCCALHCTALCVPCCTAVVGRGQWAVDLLQRTATPPGGYGQWNSCNALPHCLGAVGSGTAAVQCLTALGQWAVQLLQCTAPLLGGSGQWNSCNTLPHRPGAVGSGTPVKHCLTAWGQWAVELPLLL